MTDTNLHDPRVERTKAAVLDAGRAILFERGPEAVTHAGVAAAASFSRTTVYKYWPTRAELLFEVLHHAEPRKEVEPSGDVRQDLQTMGRDMAASFRDERLTKVLISLIAQAQWDDDSVDAQQALIEAAMANVSRVIDAAVDAGQLPERIDPLRVAGRIIGPIFFAAVIARTPLSVDEVETLIDDWLATAQR